MKKMWRWWDKSALGVVLLIWVYVVGAFALSFIRWLGLV